MEEKFKHYELKIKIHKAFGNLYRKKHTLIVCIDKNKKILVGSKPDFYPKNITRLLGGGIREGEDETSAALRELQEETGLNFMGKDLISLGDINVVATTDGGETFNMVTYLFAVSVDSTQTRGGDDVKFIIGFDKLEFGKLIKSFYELPDDFWYEGVEGKHSWGDYGKVYGFIHEVALKEISSRGLI